jgi:hypothetical protein
MLRRNALCFALRTVAGCQTLNISAWDVNNDRFLYCSMVSTLGRLFEALQADRGCPSKWGNASEERVFIRTGGSWID